FGAAALSGRAESFELPVNCVTRGGGVSTVDRVEVLSRMIPIWLMLMLLFSDVKVTFDHNSNSHATREFKFKNIASPAKDDAAANAKLTLIDGELDQGSGSLATLIDGR